MLSDLLRDCAYHSRLRTRGMPTIAFTRTYGPKVCEARGAVTASSPRCLRREYRAFPVRVRKSIERRRFSKQGSAPGGVACCARVGRNQRRTPRAPYVGCEPHVAGCRRRACEYSPRRFSESIHRMAMRRACSLQARGWLAKLAFVGTVQSDDTAGGGATRPPAWQCAGQDRDRIHAFERFMPGLKNFQHVKLPVPRLELPPDRPGAVQAAGYGDAGRRER